MPLQKRRAEEKNAKLLGYKTSYLHFRNRQARGVMVCFHGWLDNAGSFIPLAQALPELEIFAWDFPGHGKSAHRHPGERYHYIDLVPFIEAAVRHIAVPEVLLCGHSMGASASALYAGALGERIKALLLIEGLSPIVSEPEEAAQILANGVRGFYWAQSLAKPVYRSLEDAIRVRMRANGLSRESLLPLVKRAVKRVPGGITWRADFRLRAPPLLRLGYDQVKNILLGIRVPALLILGQDGMPQLTEAVRKEKKLRKKLEIALLPGNHHLHLQYPDAVAGSIRQFLQKKQLL